jgi:hypothetical protein
MRTAEDVRKELAKAEKAEQKRKNNLARVKQERTGNIPLTTKALSAFQRREHT